MKSCKDFVELLNEQQREALMEIEREIRKAVSNKYAQQNNFDAGNALEQGLSDDSDDFEDESGSPMGSPIVILSRGELY